MASQIGGSKIDVPIRVPNELFIKVGFLGVGVNSGVGVCQILGFGVRIGVPNGNLGVVGVRNGVPNGNLGVLGPKFGGFGVRNVGFGAKFGGLEVEIWCFFGQEKGSVFGGRMA